MLANDRLERRAHAMIATMEAADDGCELERRQTPRRRHLVQATLRIPGGQGATGQGITLYTRDVCVRGVGFILLADDVPATRAMIHLQSPDGRIIEAEADLVRAQSFAHGWREGFARFSGAINLFCEEPICAA